MPENDEIGVSPEVQAMQGKPDAQQAMLKKFESEQIKAHARLLASNVSTKEALRENEKKIKVTKLPNPSSKRSYELMADFQFCLEDMADSWAEVLPDGIGDEEEPNVAALLDQKKLPAIAKAVIATASTAAELMDKAKHEQRMIEAAAAARLAGRQ